MTRSAKRTARIRGTYARLGLSVLVSLLLNALLLWVLPLDLRSTPVAEPELDQSEPIAYVPVEAEAPSGEEPSPRLPDPNRPPPPPEPVALVVLPDPPEPPESEPEEGEEAEQAEELPTPERSLRSVYQPSVDEQIPVEANYLAEVDNATDIETQAEDTTLDSPAPEPELFGDELPSDDPGAEEVELSEVSEPVDEPEPDGEEYLEGSPEPRVSDLSPEPPQEASFGGGEEADEVQRESSEELAAIDVPDSAPAPGVIEESELIELPAVVGGLEAFRLSAPRAAGASERTSVIREVGRVDPGSYLEVFGARDASDRVLAERDAREASFLGDQDGRWERTRAALENFDVHAVPGRETSLNTRSDEVASYIHHLHNKMHERWWEYLGWLQLTHGPADTLSDLSLVVDIELVISRVGDVEDVRVVDGSGALEFDATAIDLMYEIGPHRSPPPGILSSDGNAYVYWSFHRDTRGCGTFGAATRRFEFEEGEGG